jgi:isopenicillin-N N-acyltransferase-like protein
VTTGRYPFFSVNSDGIGVTLNAIHASHCDVSKLPLHLGLRRVLESRSIAEAVTTLEKTGIATTGHFLIADADGALGLEVGPKGFGRIEEDNEGFGAHWVATPRKEK